MISVHLHGLTFEKSQNEKGSPGTEICFHVGEMIQESQTVPLGLPPHCI